jgi:transposase-like protein
MAREAPRIILSPYELIDLRRLVNAHSTPQALAFRARLILRCAHAQPPTNEQVAHEFGCAADTVAKWRSRFRCQRLEGLQDLPRSGRPAAFSPSRPPPRRRPGHHQARRLGRARRTLVVG